MRETWCSMMWIFAYSRFLPNKVELNLCAATFERPRGCGDNQVRFASKSSYCSSHGSQSLTHGEEKERIIIIFAHRKVPQRNQKSRRILNYHTLLRCQQVFNRKEAGSFP